MSPCLSKRPNLVEEQPLDSAQRVEAGATEIREVCIQVCVPSLHKILPSAT